MGSLDYGIPNIPPRFPNAEASGPTQSMSHDPTINRLTLTPPAIVDTDQMLHKQRTFDGFGVPESGLWLTQLLASWDPIDQFNGYRFAYLEALRGDNPIGIARYILNAEQKGPRTNLVAVSHSILGIDPLLKDDFIIANLMQSNGGGTAQNIISAADYSPRIVAYKFSNLDRFIGLYLYRSSNQSIPNVTQTAVQFDRVDFDRGFNWGNPSANSIVTIREAGIYLIMASTQWAGVSGGYRGTAIRHQKSNGTTVGIPAYAKWYPGDTTPCWQPVVAILKCDPGDQISVLVDQASGGGSLNLLAVTGHRTPNLRILKLASIDPGKVDLKDMQSQISYMFAYQSANQNYGISGAAQGLTYDKLLFDTDKIATEYDHPVPAPPAPGGRFRIRRRGIYLIQANLNVTYGPVIERVLLRIMRNGTMIAANSANPEQNADLCLNCVRLIELFPGDQISIAYSNSSNNRTLNGVGATTDYYKNSVAIVGLHNQSTQGSGRYFDGCS